MYLKTLKVVGFKSFADRTRLEFRPGVAVVVGPNGSGKSNLVDAIHWVMGSQAPKSLRTGKMDDVIFAGTVTRPAFNRTEVTVIFDNGGRQLPLDLDEVSITRRLYRDGSSDYEINGVGCRLLDIQELLSDSGVGRHQHVIINQGQVDAILNAGPEEHRAVIEEAAGILKHKLRRDRASRRLERTDEDVLRLNDLLAEMARQIRPLKRQAEAAGRYWAVAAEARHLGLFLGGEGLRTLDRRIAEAAVEESFLDEQVKAAGEVLDEVGGQLRTITADAARVGLSLDRDTAAAARLETTIERLRRVAQVAQERHRTRRARWEGASERRRDLVAELAQLDAELDQARSDDSAAASAAETAEGRFRVADDQVTSLADQDGLGPEGALAVMAGDLRSLASAEQRDRRELEAVSRQVEVVEGQVHHETAEIARLAVEIMRLDEGVAAAQSTYESVAVERRGCQEVWEESEAASHQQHLLVAGARARLEAVEAAAAGIADPAARELVEGAAGALGGLISRLDVPPRWAAAVDAALGPWVDAVAFSDPEAMAAAVGELKGAGRGGVGVVNSARSESTNDEAANHEHASNEPPGDARRLAAAAGLEALIDQLGPGADGALGHALLGDVVVVEGWSAGWNLVRRHPRLRAVTPEGDLITCNGIRVAHPDGASLAMVEAASIEAERAERELARAQSRQTTARRQFEESRAGERSALEELESLEAKLAGAVEAKGRADRAATELEASRHRLAERAGALRATLTERQEQRDLLAASIAALEGTEAEQQRLTAERAAQREEIGRRRDEALEAWQEAAAIASAARSRRTLLEDRRQVVEAEAAADEGAPISPAAVQRLIEIEAVARQAVDLLKAKIDQLRARQHEERASARELGEDLARLRSEYDASQAQVTSARERLGALAVEQAESRVRREAAAEALRRELDASEDEALTVDRPDLPGGESLSAALASRQAELRRMGPINPLAADEYRQLAERHDFMAMQLADLDTSRSELKKVIKALDEEIESQFMAAFDEVAAAYESQFGLLFPGGKGRIRLAEPDDRLASGVEIEAQPLGKKIGRLSLLSGGERSLAALAFLFSVFKARPSPFYVLDEVEAALDDANLRRFLRLVDAFREESQLIIVTHQQQTMEAADVLYGVTMEPGGSSMVVAKALSTSSLVR
ncbi:MAG TPA: chromosome segregation protein SMC [Acidimicrobiia bacterium]|nr:chromosome segregation protein SMC [Acidimicrobiia bacterium]